MQTISTIGLDIAKSVFQVHGVDAAGQVAVRRQLKRRQVGPATCPLKRFLQQNRPGTEVPRRPRFGRDRVESGPKADIEIR